MNRLLNAFYAMAIAVPTAAAFLGLGLHDLRIVLGVDFLAVTGLASYLGLKPPAPPSEPEP